MHNSTVIEIRKLSKLYKLYSKPIYRLKEAIFPFGKKNHREFYAIRELDLTICKGEIVGIIGKNGSGKSTLLKMLTGVLTPTAGTIQVNGRVSALLELGAGFNPEFTGIENIYFHGTIMGYSKEEMDDKVEEIIEFADIGDFIHQPVKSYSSGMFVRLAFAVAVAIEPEILIIDEALAVGDLRFQQKAIRKMQKIMENAKAIIFVSHDMRSIRTFCTRVVWLMNGSIFRDGDVKEITRQYEDYMEHGVLPDEKSVISIDKAPERIQLAAVVPDDSEIKWQELPQCNALGGQQAAFTNIAIYINGQPYSGQEIIGNEEIIVYAHVIVCDEIIRPLLGFGIFNEKGMSIVHFNSASIKNHSRTALLAQTAVTFKYRVVLPNLCNGVYFLSLGIDDGYIGDSQPIHHIQECCCLRVNRQDLCGKQHGMILSEQATIECICSAMEDVNAKSTK